MYYLIKTEKIMKRMIIAAALIFAASQIAFAQDDKTKVDPQNVPTAQAPAQEPQKEEAQPAENKEQSEAQPAEQEKAAEQQTEGAKAE